MIKSLKFGFNVLFVMAVMYYIAVSVMMWWDAGEKLKTFGTILAGAYLLVLRIENELLRFLMKGYENER